MELKNMTNEELTELVGKINIELRDRKANKCEEYKKKLSELIDDIISEGYDIRLFSYSEEYGGDTEIMIDDYYSNYDIIIE